MRFNPSRHSYGDALADEVLAEEAPQKSATDFLQYIPLVRELVVGTDPEVEAEKVRSLLKQKKKTLREQPWQAFILNPQIASLEGRLIGLDIQAADARESAELYQVGQFLTVAGIGVAVVAMAGVSFWVFQKAQQVRAETQAMR